ncbi:serine/threonine-protein kinase Rio1 [Halolamina salifodinae]|uniref:non-specific serine/threonine protein kinase n=1 Tax=Halolamina salifodinae TaxID=1202767 RepID=A0A8T4GYH6_9EURY|nr:serine/threonine-protein kinase Rio1 [Halolamina salifodinae]MBP1986425.1 RIO kinase 1 [Halolamina salifodinae]
MSEDYGFVDEEMAKPGDEFEEIEVADTEVDSTARRQDREFDEFRKRLKNVERLKVEQGAFDDATLAALYKLVQDGHVGAFGGPLSTGKEANVYEARGESGNVAVKIYRINASDFRQMREYLEGDPRFEGLENNKKATVLAWTRKEFANLKRAAKAGVRVPEPIAVQRNVLVMELVGQADERRAPRLAEVDVENPQQAYEVVREYMRRLHAAGLVHGDLSEYNMIVHEGELVIIDMGQAVTVHHPNSGEFLTRDCKNVAAFFSRQGIDVTGEELEAYVTEADPASDESAE